MNSSIKNKIKQALKILKFNSLSQNNIRSISNTES